MADPSGRVVVVGGGLAGLAAASKLARFGVPVTLLEARETLGGRASSFFDDVTGDWIDACQHVSMGCCVQLADFLRDAGMAGAITQQRLLTFLDADGNFSRFPIDPVFFPLHLTRGFVFAKFLTIREKLQVSRAMLALCRQADWRDDASFDDWLTQRGQCPRVKQRYWAPVLTSALNETLDRIDYRYARQVFVEGFLASSRAGVIALPELPLRQFYGDALEQALSLRHVEIRKRSPVRALLGDTHHTTGVELKSGETVRADHVVVAVPLSRVAEILGADRIAAHPMLERIGFLETSPITSVHLWFDRQPLGVRNVAILGGTTQWLFQRPTTQGAAEGSAYVQAVISASRELAKLGKDAIEAQVVDEIRRLVPGARGARLLRAKVITERQATFSVTPGVDRLRPAQKTPVTGLWLAGDYTQTGWPATMEGAVRSGYRVAEGILALSGRSETILQEPLGWSWTARLLIRRAR